MSYSCVLRVSCVPAVGWVRVQFFLKALMSEVGGSPELQEQLRLTLHHPPSLLQDRKGCLCLVFRSPTSAPAQHSGGGTWRSLPDDWGQQVRWRSLHQQPQRKTLLLLRVAAEGQLAGSVTSLKMSDYEYPHHWRRLWLHPAVYTSTCHLFINPPPPFVNSFIDLFIYSSISLVLSTKEVVFLIFTKLFLFSLFRNISWWSEVQRYCRGLQPVRRERWRWPGCASGS